MIDVDVLGWDGRRQTRDLDGRLIGSGHTLWHFSLISSGSLLDLFLAGYLLLITPRDELCCSRDSLLATVFFMRKSDLSILLLDNHYRPDKPTNSTINGE